MLPTINGKLLHECELADIQLMLNNPDYRENAYLDFKINFAFLEVGKEDKKDRNAKVAEFRSDVCSFANSDGGYLVYGISEDKGIPQKIMGVTIPNNNTDKFELDRKNNLNAIMPKLPSVQFKFVRLPDDKYIVILYVQHDFFAPYVHLENESDYRIYRRVNNGKSVASYQELKTMFTQSLSLEDEILHFRKNRIQYYRSQEDTSDHRYSRFSILHIIPDTFSNSNYSRNLFILEKRKGIRFNPIFLETRCSGYIVPNVDGLRGFDISSGTETLLYNNGSMECFFPLESNYWFGIYPETPSGNLHFDNLWEIIEEAVKAYFNLLPKIFDTDRYFVSLSFFGCKDAVSYYDSWRRKSQKIDRNEILCPLTVFIATSDHDEVEKNLKFLKLNSKLALSMNDSDVTELLRELYP